MADNVRVVLDLTHCRVVDGELNISVSTMLNIGDTDAQDSQNRVRGGGIPLKAKLKIIN